MVKTRYAVVVAFAFVAACGGDDNSDKNTNTPPTNATLTSITVSGSTSSIVAAATLQLTALGHYDDKSVNDVSATATWASSSDAIATVSPTGLVTGVANGAATISASVGSIRGALSITVVEHVADATITAIAITPANPSVGVTGTQQLTATATYNDATTKDVSADASWTTKDDTTVDVDQTGLVTGVKVGGPIQITAELDAVAGSTNVTVTTAPVLSVSGYTPKANTKNARANTPFTVTFGSAVNKSTVTVQATSGACSGSVQVSCDNFTTCVGLATPTYSTDSTQATFAPAAALPAFATCAVKVKTAVHGADGGTMPSDQTQGPGVTIATDGACANSLVIDQVYGGGGEATATYTNDYVVLHNSGPVAVTINGWSIQYAAATGTTWTAMNLPNGSIAAGAFYLVSLASGGAVGTALPTADATGTLDLADAAGKVALVTNTTVLSGSCPLSQTFDFVGYGGANCAEGTAVAALSAATSASRVGHCDETNANSVDFTAATPLAQNSATTAAVCSCIAITGSVAQIDNCTLTPATLTATAGLATAAITLSVLEAGVTDINNLMTTQVGAGPQASDPTSSEWVYSAASFTVQVGTADDYSGTVIAPSPAGTYSYVGRSTRDGTNWTYCDLDGNGSSGGTFSDAEEGALTSD